MFVMAVRCFLRMNQVAPQLLYRVLSLHDVASLRQQGATVGDDGNFPKECAFRKARSFLMVDANTIIVLRHHRIMHACKI